MTDAAFQGWVEQARSVRIEREIGRRGIKLKGRIERVGPCPKCGGDDRFSINTNKQLFNCRSCGVGGDVIDLVQFLDNTDFTAACTTLAGERPNCKDNNKVRMNTISKEVVAANFPYHDERGEVVLVVDRIEYRLPDGSFVMKDGKRVKSFRQKRPDPDRGWINNANGVPVIPYRLPELIEAVSAGHTIFVVEGEGKADLLWQWFVPATCCVGGAKKWKPEHSKYLQGADVIIMPDHDAAGYAHAEAVAAMLTGGSRSVRVLKLAEHWPACKERDDAANWIAAGHTREQLDELIKQAKSWEREAPRFKLVPFDALTVGSTIVYLVKGLIPRTGLVVVWGPPKCGKSFWVFDLVMHPALGWPYRKRKTLSGPVVYCAFEGAEGYGRRAEAFRRKHLLDAATPVPFFLVPARMTFAKDHQAFIRDIKAQIGDKQPVAIVLDTLNRSLGGSENDDEAMGNYIKAGDAVREAFNCVVIIVHHCGIEGNRPRGHTSLTGAVDAQLAVKRDAAGQIVVTVEWMKDGPEGETVVSRLETLDVGTEPDGKPITSCAIVPAEATVEAGKQTKPSKMIPKAAKTALRALHEAIAEVGTVPPASNHLPAGVRVVTIEQWRQYAYRMGISAADTTLRAKQKSFKSATDYLIGNADVGTWDDQFWPT
jgi:hypothetical protein